MLVSFLLICAPNSEGVLTEDRSGVDAVLKRMNLNQLQLLVSALQNPDCIFQRQVPEDQHAYVMEQALVCRYASSYPTALTTNRSIHTAPKGVRRCQMQMRYS